jgi:2-(1,2-epoxy-1,2-dihydrophenyl)acetyl-CoA isomerase
VLELLYTGRRVPGEERCVWVCAIGWRRCPSSRAQAREFAAEIAASTPLAIEAIRATQRGELAQRIRAATARERFEQERLQGTADFREGLPAAAERREPDFTRK